MTGRSIFLLLRLPLAVAVLLVSLAINAQAQGGVPEEQRLGAGIEFRSMPYLQGQPPAAQVAPQDPTTSGLPGTRVVFESYRDGNYEIYIDNDDSSNLIRLTKNSNVDIEPRLARGGSKIVFASNRFSNQFDILTMNLDGSGVTRLTTTNQDDRRPVWSPDGSKILFQTKRDGNWEIYIMDADGTNQTRLTNHPDDDITPNWSPDGSKIVWSAYKNGGYRIWVMNSDGSGATQLSQQPYSENPAWSPNGSMIAYDAESNGDGWQEIWVMNADGSNPRMLSFSDTPQSAVDYLACGWSPASDSITLTSVTYVLNGSTWYITRATLSVTSLPNFSLYIHFLNSNYLDFFPDWQTLDITAPSSHVNSLPAQSPNPFFVSWSGEDTGPSGLKNYDLQVRDGLTGTWGTWFDGTYEISHSFSGIAGHTYYFRSRARDRCCNIEKWPEDYDAFTTIEDLPPITTVNPLPELSPTELVISWTGYDPGGSGINDYNVQYKMDGGGWESWFYMGGPLSWTSALFSGSSGHKYVFRICSSDNAGNYENCPADGPFEAQTTIVSFGLEGNIIDNTGNPVADAIVESSLPPFQNSPSQVDGSYRTLVTTDNDTITLNWEKNGYGTLSATDFSPLPLVGNLDISLPPNDNVLANPGLEYSEFSNLPWSIGGIIPPAVSFDSPHTGKTSMRLGAADIFTHVDPIPSALSGGVSEGLRHATEPDGTIHVIWLSGTTDHYNLFYAQRSSDGLWSAPMEIVHNDKLAGYGTFNQVAVGPDGTVHILWGQHDAPNPIIMYAQRSPSGSWSTPVSISPFVVFPDIHMVVDSRGVVSVAWNIKNYYDPNSIFLTQRDSSGTWSAPIDICHGHPAYPTSYEVPSDQFFIGVNSADTLYFVWRDKSDNLVFRYLPINGEWSEDELIDPGVENYMFNAQIDTGGKIHIITMRGNPQKLYYIQLNANGSWSSPMFVSDLYSPNVLKVVLDKNSGLHVLWDKQSNQNYLTYVYKPMGGVWSSPQIISDETVSIYNISMATDIHGNPVVAWKQQGDSWGPIWKAMYTQKLADGWQTGQFASPFDANFDGITLSSDDSGWIIMAWFDRTSGKAYISSLMETVGTSGGNSELSQVVTLTPSLTAPVLSFYYQLNNATLDNAAHLDVSVIHGTDTPLLFSTTANTANWTHHWLDVSKWIGQEITVSFRLFLTAGQSPAYALIDDVTIGSTSPDICAGSFLAGPAFPGNTVVLNLVYGNRGAPPAKGVNVTATLPAELAFTSAKPTPTTKNGQTLTWKVGDLVGFSGPLSIKVISTLTNDATFFSTLEGSIQVETQSPELETANNTVPILVIVGSRQYLPAISR